MANRILERYRDAAKSLRKHLDTEKFRIHTPEKAFIHWYMFARFGKPEKYTITDGAKDGGIDAILENKGVLYILQTKYEVVPRVSSITRGEIAGFEKVVNLLENPDGTGFQEWLKTCQPSLHNDYKALRKRVLKQSGDVRYILVTTKRLADIEQGETIELEEIQHMAALWDLYQDGFTPPTESICLTLGSVWHNSSSTQAFNTYVGLADVKDFLDLMEEDKNERLFAQNVRTDLRSRINKDIRDTYENHPDKFWLGNNGIYIVCKKVTPTGNSYRLVFPSIINGSQTLHSVFASANRHSCKILVRILEMDIFGNPQLLSEVIRRTNTQNPMKLINLSAHDLLQLNVARYLDRYKLFYERREKEWQNEKRAILSDYKPVNIKDVAQWLSTIHGDIGLGRARSRLSELFQDKYYKQIFNSFDASFNSPKYDLLTSVIWAGLFARNAADYIGKQTKPFAKMSHLLLTKLMFNVVRSHKLLQSAIGQKLGKHEFGNREIPAQLTTEVKQIVQEFLRLQKKEQETDLNADFSNYFKKDELCRLAYEKACAPRVPKIARLLSESIQDIY